MVNVIIYLDKINEAKELIDSLLKLELIANASIDTDNVSYKMENGEVVQTINNVITAQTKSLLFHELEIFIKEKYSNHVPIYCIPIINSNLAFDDFIRNNTKKI